MEPAKFGEEITDYVRFALPKPKAIAERVLKGAVIKVDRFGNLITNIDATLIERFRLPLIHAGNHAFALLRTYADTRPGELRRAMEGGTACQGRS